MFPCCVIVLRPTGVRKVKLPWRLCNRIKGSNSTEIISMLHEASLLSRLVTTRSVAPLSVRNVFRGLSWWGASFCVVQFLKKFSLLFCFHFRCANFFFPANGAFFTTISKQRHNSESEKSLPDDENFSSLSHSLDDSWKIHPLQDSGWWNNRRINCE